MDLDYILRSEVSRSDADMRKFFNNHGGEYLMTVDQEGGNKSNNKDEITSVSWNRETRRDV